MNSDAIAIGIILVSASILITYFVLFADLIKSVDNFLDEDED